MLFGDSETQRLLRTTARSYLAGAYPWERLYRIERGEERLDEASLREFADLGWFGLLAPEAGDGASLLDAAAVVEEFGYAGVPSPVAVANIAGYLLRESTAAGASEHLARLARGERLLTVSETTRRRAGDSSLPLSASGGRLEGTLPIVPFAEDSAYVLAPFTLDGEAAFGALPLDGAAMEPLELLDRRCYADVHFHDAPLDGALVLATGSEAEELRERCDALVTALSLIELAGLMQRVLELTTGHISTRVQFGQPIGKFQAARHRAAELLTQVETTRWAAYHALWRFQEDPADREELWLAKHWAVRAADRAFQTSHLLHGGVGVGMEHPLHLFTQSIAAFAVRGGTMDEMVFSTVESLELAEAR